tara:strand:+ start:30313 stop:31401 length:1089 start_codon:yes stop_codon:yes gene_type:complete
MAFGKSKDHKKLPNSNDILSAVSDLEIFEMYLGGIPRKAISSPLREDTKPSFSLFHSDNHGKIFFKDFATGESGDCFLFVMRLFNLQSKVDTFNKIASDFNLTQFELKTTPSRTFPSKTHVSKSNSKKSIKSDRVRISIRTRDWKIRDKTYWSSKYELTKDQLEYCNVFPISHYFINGFCTKADDLAYAFVEEKDGIQTFKIYQPFNQNGEKWINNNDFSTWELWTQLPEKGNILIITSSRKDAMVIKSLFPSNQITSCSLQSEGVNPKMSVVNELKGRFKEIFVLYDNDYNSDKNRGRLAGEKLCEQAGLLQLEIPTSECRQYGVKDPSDYLDALDGIALKNLIIQMIKQRLRDEELKNII